MNHGAKAVWKAVDTSVDYVDPYTEEPSSTWFSEGNGDEFRKSFHGYPIGFAQVVHKPRKFNI